MALTARAARRKIAKLLEALTEREPCQGEGRGFKSLFPLSNQKVTRSAECISKVMHSADALWRFAPSDWKTLWPFGPRVFLPTPLTIERQEPAIGSLPHQWLLGGPWVVRSGFYSRCGSVSRYPEVRHRGNLCPRRST